MDWSEESPDIQETPEWLIVVSSTAIVALLIVAPCFSSHQSSTSPHARSRRRRRREDRSGSSTSSSQFISVEDSNEVELRTIPAPAQSTLSMARRSQLMERQQAALAVTSNNVNPIPQRAMSQAAGSVLEEIETELDEAEQEEHEQMNRNRILRRQARYFYDDEASVMPPLHPDEVAPEDAADAHDIGIAFPHYINNRQVEAPTSETKWEVWGNLLLDIANPFFETRRILNAAFPTFIANLVLPLQHVCLAVVVGKFLNTESALAYILVELFLRVTVDNICTCICEAHSNLLQDQSNLGSTLQLALSLQVLVLLPILVAWYFGMEGTIQWLLGDPVLAEIARNYTNVMIWEHLVRSISRGVVQPFRWMIQYENSLVEFTVSSVSILLIVGIRPDSLTGVGIVKLCTTMISTVVKVYFVSTQSWFTPHRRGLTERLMLLDGSAVSAFWQQMIPLLLSTILEMGEWDILIVLVRRLGMSEVATWAILSLFWELFGSLTQGLGEAASARITEYLATGFYQEAILVSRKTIFFGFILAGSVGSFFLLLAPGVANVLTFDNSLREDIAETGGLLSLAVVTKIFSQLYWHLASAQGRLGLATLGTLATKWLFMLPASLLLVFAFRLDLRSLLLVIGSGYAGKSFVLGYQVFYADWKELARLTRDRAEEAFEEEEEYYDEDDDDDEYSFEDETIDATEKAPGPLDEIPDVDSYTPETQLSTPAHEESDGSDSDTLPLDFEGKSEFDRFTPALV